MNKLIEKLTPTDLIAFILIIGCLILKGFEFNGTISNILITIVTVYFGKTQVVDPIIKKKSKIISEEKSEQTMIIKNETVEQTIRRIAKLNGVDPELAIRIAKCESSLNPNAININKTGSKDRGVFQWNDFWHPDITDKMAFDVETATKLFCDAINKLIGGMPQNLAGINKTNLYI